MNIHLKRGEKIYVNGAVLRIDRRASIEFLNDVTFLLEPHIMQAEAATTPVRQLYFVVQTMLIDPENATTTLDFYRDLALQLAPELLAPALQDGLKQVERKLALGRTFEALRLLRGLFEADHPTAPAQRLEHASCN